MIGQEVQFLIPVFFAELFFCSRIRASLRHTPAEVQHFCEMLQLILRDLPFLEKGFDSGGYFPIFMELDHDHQIKIYDFKIISDPLLKHGFG
ncbi:Uncharacterised protein [Mycobacteroides abscessus subsp. abscessus]|nr:Uncharacterised protein [Mycobacteroides abscessus subsp. abscessus]